MQLFYYAPHLFESSHAYFYREYGIAISKAFMQCFDQQLRVEFETKTGLKIGKQVCMSMGGVWDIAYKKGEVSEFMQSIYINHNWNPVKIIWKSHSGRIYGLDDEDIDCNDIEFHFEHLDTLLYHRQLYPKAELPFRLKDLTYELVVLRLNRDCTIDMTLREHCDPKSLRDQIDNFINAFNEKSIKKGCKDGVVNNSKRTIENNHLIYDIDTGSGGFIFEKKLLLFLSKLDSFEKVEVG